MMDETIPGVILRKLRETEENYKVRIAFAVESGSRSWGFASPDSDYDCRFVYVHNKDWYLSVLPKPDMIGYAADKVFDVNGWDVRKCIAHITKSNAVMMEWLSSTGTYIHDERAFGLLRQLARQFFNPVSVSYHYLSLAVKKYHEIVGAGRSKIKTYFYVLRPLANLRFIEQYGSMPHMNCFRTLAEIDMDSPVREAIMELADIKKSAGEKDLIPRHSLLEDYFAAETARQKERLRACSFAKNRDYEQADCVFRDVIEMMWGHG